MRGDNGRKMLLCRLLQRNPRICMRVEPDGLIQESMNAQSEENLRCSNYYC